MSRHCYSTKSQDLRKISEYINNALEKGVIIEQFQIVPTRIEKYFGSPFYQVEEYSCVMIYSDGGRKYDVSLEHNDKEAYREENISHGLQGR